MSGANLPDRQVRKGAAQAIESYAQAIGATSPSCVHETVETISRKGGTALVVIEGKKFWVSFISRILLKVVSVNAFPNLDAWELKQSW